MVLTPKPNKNGTVGKLQTSRYEGTKLPNEILEENQVIHLKNTL